MDKERIIKALKNRSKVLWNIADFYERRNDEINFSIWCRAWNEIYDVVRALENDEAFEEYEKHNSDLAN